MSIDALLSMRNLEQAEFFGIRISIKTTWDMPKTWAIPFGIRIEGVAVKLESDMSVQDGPDSNIHFLRIKPLFNARVLKFSEPGEHGRV